LFNSITDTVDLTEDFEAKDFWFNCLRELIDKISIQALNSSPINDETAFERVEKFKTSYKNKLELLKNSQNKETLSVRTLLELNEKFLKQVNPFLYIRQKIDKLDKTE
jgi:hypothetical protein